MREEVLLDLQLGGLLLKNKNLVELYKVYIFHYGCETTYIPLNSQYFNPPIFPCSHVPKHSIIIYKSIGTGMRYYWLIKNIRPLHARSQLSG